MTLDELKAAVEAARRFTHTVDGRTFQIRLPTSHEVKMAYARARTGTEDHIAAFYQSQREIAERAVTGWTEVNETDLVPEGTNTPMAFEASLVPLIFDAHAEWQTAISDAIDKHLAERERKQEAAAKN